MADGHEIPSTPILQSPNNILHSRIKHYASQFTIENFHVIIDLKIKVSLNIDSNSTSSLIIESVSSKPSS